MEHVRLVLISGCGNRGAILGAPSGIHLYNYQWGLSERDKPCIIVFPVPFINAYERATHFQKHGHKFGAATEEEYEQMADAFMVRALSPILQECIRHMSHQEPDRVRLHFDDGHFGVAYRTNILRTFHIKYRVRNLSRAGAAALLAEECRRTDA